MQTRQEAAPPETWLTTLNHGPASVALGNMRIELIYHGYDARHPDNQPHRHSFYEVCLVGRGAGRFIVAEVAHPIQAGDLFVARPGVVHQIVSSSQPEMELYWIAYQLHRRGDDRGDELAALLDGYAASPVIVAADDGRCARMWSALRAVAEGGQAVGAREQMGWITSCLITAIAQVVDPGPAVDNTGEGQDAQLVRQALRYIEDNLTRPLSPVEVAGHVGLSQRHFTRLFSVRVGCTFSAYLTRARVDRALARLQHTDATIKEIAAELGFADVHYFGRIFTRTVGVSPGHIRRLGAQPGRSVYQSGEFV